MFLSLTQISVPGLNYYEVNNLLEIKFQCHCENVIILVLYDITSNSSFSFFALDYLDQLSYFS